MTETAAQYVLQHSSGQWLTMKYVVIRIMEQWWNLEEYFLLFVSKQEEFKRSIKGSKWYESTVECLENNMTLTYLAFTENPSRKILWFICCLMEWHLCLIIYFKFLSTKSHYILMQMDLVKWKMFQMKPSSFIHVETKAKNDLKQSLVILIMKVIKKKVLFQLPGMLRCSCFISSE